MKYSLFLTTLLSFLPSTAAFCSPSVRTTTRSNSQHQRIHHTIRMVDDDEKSMPDISMPDFSKITDSLASYDVGTVVSNLSSSNEELGNRGEAYFVAQAALILFILIGGVPVIGEPLQSVLGPSLLLGGLAIAGLALVDLGADSLSPFPAPPQTATLKSSGIYGQMRHPMYTGLLTVMAGLSLWTNSADRLLLTALLWYLVEVKSDKEEEFLMKQFPGEYAKYKVSFVSWLVG